MIHTIEKHESARKYRFLSRLDGKKYHSYISEWYKTKRETREALNKRLEFVKTL